MSRILVVEDEESLAKLLAYNLTQKGFEVEIIMNGAEVLPLLTPCSFDLVLLDVMLPGMNGIDLCKKLRSLKINIPVIMLTAKTGEEEIVEGLLAGADDYITKPFSIMELVARVQSSLRRANDYETSAVQTAKDLPLDDPDQIRFGDILIHAGKMEAFVGETELDLRPKEYNILLHFVQKKGNVVTREELITSIWGYDYIGEQRTVDVHVSSLRKKLEMAKGCGTFIESVRGIGYKIVHQLSGESG